MGRLILPEFPELWVTAPIGQIAKIVYGDSLREQSRNQAGNIPVYGSNGIVGYHDQYIHAGPGIIIGRKGTAGSVHFIKGPFYCIDTTFYLDEILDVFDIEFLAFTLKSIDLTRLSIVVGVPGINRTDLEREIIPVPPLSEQKRIVEILEQPDELCQTRQQADERIQDLQASLFHEMFGDPITNNKKWDVEKVSLISDLVRGSSPRPQGDPRYFGGHVPRLMVADLTRDGIYVTPRIDSLTEEGATKSRPMKAGEVVMAVSGAPGLPAILNIDACIHDGFVGFRNLSDELIPEYFVGVILAFKSRSASQAEGAIFKNLKTDQINRWQIPIPPKDLQLEYLARFQDSIKLMKSQSEISERLNHLYQSILTRAFTGELTAKWRGANAAMLQDEAAQRDTLLGTHPKITRIVEQIAEAEPEKGFFSFDEVHPRYQVLSTLGEEQRNIYSLIQQQVNYFTAASLSYEGTLSFEAIRRALPLLETLGLISQVSVEISPDNKDVYYVDAYRNLTDTDTIRSGELEILRGFIDDLSKPKPAQ